MSFKHVRLQHDNAPAHTSATVTFFFFLFFFFFFFFVKRKGNSFTTPSLFKEGEVFSYSPDLAPCDFFFIFFRN